MGKNTQIFLLGLVFVISGAAGYFIEGALFGDEDKQVVEIQEEVQPEVVLSPVPVIEVTEVPKKVKGNYSFVVTASTESGDTELKYALYRDVECTQEVASNYDGRFADIQGVESQIYYLKVWNIQKGIWSDVVPVTGFVAPQEFKIAKPLTKADIQTIINDYYSASKEDINVKISSKCAIVPQGMRNDDIGVSTLGDVSAKLTHGVWSSVNVVDIDHDSAGRVSRVVINVTY